MHVMSDIGNEHRRNADNMGAGGYRGVLLVKDPGNVEHRNALPGQVGDGRKRSRFSGLVVGTPGF